MKDHLVKKQLLPHHEVNANPAIDRRGNRSHIAIITGAVERPEALRYLLPIHWLSNRNGQSRGRFRKYPRDWPFRLDRKSTRLNSSHQIISYAVFCLKKKKNKQRQLQTS